MIGKSMCKRPVLYGTVPSKNGASTRFTRRRAICINTIKPAPDSLDTNAFLEYEYLITAKIQVQIIALGIRKSTRV